MRINLKQFKKVRENNESATLKNERGHEITLTKKALRPHLLKAVTDMPVHLFEDGEVPSVAPEEAPAENLDTLHQVDPALLQQRLEQIKNIPAAIRSLWHSDKPDPFLSGGQPQAAQPEMAPQAPAAVPPQALSTLDQELNPPSSAPSRAAPPAAKSPMDSMPDAYSQYQGGVNQQIRGIQGEARAQDEMRHNLAPQAQAHADSLKQSFENYQSELQDINMERERIQEDIRNGHIQPNHYMENMDSGQKRNMAIGIILSGAGAGLSGKDNLAIKYLNDQIGRDIDAQKTNLSSNQNLLAANTHRYGNARLGLEATRIQLQDIMASQIAAEAAKSPYPLAKLKADQLIGSLIQNSTAQSHSLAMQTMALKQLNAQQGGGGQPMNPSSQLRLMQISGIMPHEDVKIASEELGKAQEIEKLRNAVEENAQDLNNRFLAGKLEPGYRNAKINNLAGILGKVAEGRFNLEESKTQMDAMMPGAFNRKETRGAQAAGRAQFFDSLKTTPTLDRYGIKVPKLQPIQKYAPVKGK